MKVRFKRGWSKTYPTLTAGNVYRVLEISSCSLRLIADDGDPVLFHVNAFEFVDPKQPPEWITERFDDGSISAGPPELRERGFFERYHDRDEEARRRLHFYFHQLCYREAEASPPPPNSYMRVDWKHESPDDPIELYSELDDERFEVRKVEVFRDGRVGCADGKGGSVDLGSEPVPSIEQITTSSEFVATPIDRAAFEEIWDKAFTIVNDL